MQFINRQWLAVFIAHQIVDRHELARAYDLSDLPPHRRIAKRLRTEASDLTWLYLAIWKGRV